MLNHNARGFLSGNILLLGILCLTGYALISHTSTAAIVIGDNTELNPTEEGRRESKEWRETTHDGWESENTMEGDAWEDKTESQKEDSYESWAHEVWEHSGQENGEKQHEGRKERFRERDKRVEGVPVEPKPVNR